MRLYLSYLRAFRRYAYFHMGNYSQFVQIGDYANDLTIRANYLIHRASLNNIENLAELEREMFKTGSAYVQKYALTFRKQPLEVATHAGSDLKAKGRFNEAAYIHN